MRFVEETFVPFFMKSVVRSAADGRGLKKGRRGYEKGVLGSRKRVFSTPRKGGFKGVKKGVFN